MTTILDRPRTPVVQPEHYDFKIDEMLDRTVRAIKRWGGAPVKAYVITQYISKNLNAKRTQQLIEYGVKRNLLDSWEVFSNANRPTQPTTMVGLPGGTRQPVRADGGYPRTTDLKSLIVPVEKAVAAVPLVASPVAPVKETMVTEEQKEFRTARGHAGAEARWARSRMSEESRSQQAELARKSIQKQYDNLTAAQRDEIAKLAASGESTNEIQKAYHVMGAVVGMIKRDHGLMTKRNDVTKEGVKRHYNRQKPRVMPVAVAATPDEAQGMRDTLDNARVEAAITPLIAKHSYIVTLLVMVPTEVTVTVASDSFGAAEQAALSHQGFNPGEVIEVLSVSKTRGS